MEGCSKVHPIEMEQLGPGEKKRRRSSGEVSLVIYEVKEPFRIILNPDQWMWQYWDLWLAVLLLYVAVVTPFEVAFLATEMWNTMFIINRAVDVSFAMDMIRQFFVPYSDEKQDGKIIRDNKKMALKYIQTWFFLDFFSIIPYDVLSSSLGLPDTLKFIKIIRLLRVFKLLRVMKSMRILSKYSNKSTMSYSTKQLMSFFVMIIFLAHWGACAWHLSSTLVTAEIDNWVWNYGIQGESAMTKYCTAFYWATMSITTIGYGDVVATTSTEQLFAILFMLVGGGVYAYVVGGICGIFASLNQELNDFHTAVDNLNSYMSEMNCPVELSAELRDYFLNCKDMHKEKYNREVMDMMSPGLRKKFIYECFSECIHAISFIDINMLDDPLLRFEFLSQLVLALKPVYYPPNEQVIMLNELAHNMYIIKKGLVGFQGNVLRKNQSFGDDVICGNKRSYWATTLTFSVLLRLNKDDLLGVVQQGGFEKLASTIYQKAKWMRLKQAILMFKKTADIFTELAKNGTKGIKYSWKDSEKTHLAVMVNGVEHHVIRREHVDLLLIVNPEFQMLLRPALGRHNGLGLVPGPGQSGIRSRLESTCEGIGNPKEGFRRTVPVIEMSETDLKRFLKNVMEAEVDKWIGDFVAKKILKKVDAGLTKRRDAMLMGADSVGAGEMD